MHGPVIPFFGILVKDYNNIHMMERSGDLNPLKKKREIEKDSKRIEAKRKLRGVARDLLFLGRAGEHVVVRFQGSARSFL
jgi:hypothetical protein